MKDTIGVSDALALKLEKYLGYNSEWILEGKGTKKCNMYFIIAQCPLEKRLLLIKPHRIYRSKLSAQKAEVV